MPAVKGREGVRSGARRARSFDDVVDRVRGAILAGSIPAGERLPSERELAEQFGVSRATLREALRALEALGLIEIRVGAHGGAFATEGGSGRTADVLRHAFDVEFATRPRHARQYRAAAHADSVTWAVPDQERLERLRAAIERGEAAFLRALAEATGSPVRVAVAVALESGHAAGARPSLEPDDMREVLDLLQRGERDRARALLHQRLGGTA
ncbi:FadR/GntR family transcriptional regulator [Cryptosporangium arvum]|uniref:Transcriptional regulator n=1 Tax=Cryptosporangium arvum DSM 44712 TaxID=927661 RepID=A0A010YRG7_9ACTN|nr:GntR family transcriptional regulator [Cryptosporangium arvum]EXG82775.1 transcriptional regulator [Cryptosporangium arvum DSM 44712]